MIRKPSEAPYCVVLTNLMLFSFSCYGDAVSVNLLVLIAPLSVRWTIDE
jgi:hypothetical protein